MIKRYRWFTQEVVKQLREGDSITLTKQFDLVWSEQVIEEIKHLDDGTIALELESGDFRIVLTPSYQELDDDGKPAYVEYDCEVQEYGYCETEWFVTTIYMYRSDATEDEALKEVEPHDMLYIIPESKTGCLNEQVISKDILANDVVEIETTTLRIVDSARDGILYYKKGALHPVELDCTIIGFNKY